MTWNETFESLYDRCLELYERGNTDFTSYYTQEDLDFLQSIGCKPREFFDFIEDMGDSEDPAKSTALLIAAARRDYFLTVQDGELSQKETSSDDIPGRREAFEDISYLPRITAKAQAKLRGELHPDLMFCCGGDRGFFEDHGGIHPADFLRHVWAADGDLTELADFVESHSR